MYFWTSSLPETLMKVQSVWCATALARRVLPVPGGPYNNTPWKHNIELLMTCLLLQTHETTNGLHLQAYSAEKLTASNRHVSHISI